MVKRASRAVLRRAAGDSVWGQAILAELDEVEGTWATLRWTVGGLAVAWGQRSRTTRRLAVATVCAVVTLLLANQFVLGVRYVPSGTMEPSVHMNSRIIIDKLGFKLAGLHHGDVLLLWQSGVDGTRLQTLRRLIGLPGDRIECHDGAVWRNGQAVPEPYLAEGTRTECEAYVVPDKTLYVLGDNRSAALDARGAAPASIDDLVGRVIVTL